MLVDYRWLDLMKEAEASPGKRTAENKHQLTQANTCMWRICFENIFGNSNSYNSNEKYVYSVFLWSNSNRYWIFSWNISSIFCSNSEADASELLQNIEEIFSWYSVMLSTDSNIQLHTGVLPAVKGLNDTKESVFRISSGRPFSKGRRKVFTISKKWNLKLLDYDHEKRFVIFRQYM